MKLSKYEENFLETGNDMSHCKLIVKYLPDIESKNKPRTLTEKERDLTL